MEYGIHDFFEVPLMRRKIHLHLFVCLSITSCSLPFALVSVDHLGTLVPRVQLLTADWLDLEPSGTQHVSITMDTTATTVLQDRLEALGFSAQTTVAKRIGLWAKTTSRTPFLPFMMNGAWGNARMLFRAPFYDHLDLKTLRIHLQLLFFNRGARIFSL